MPAVKSKIKSKPLAVRRDREKLGYWLGDEFREGFDDDPSLELPLRRRVAAWAQALIPDQLSADQRELLASGAAAAPPSEVQRQAAELASVEASPLWAFLSAQEQDLVRSPGSHPELDDEARYPLSVGQLVALAEVTERQLRHWDKLGLIPTRRLRNGQRAFYPAAAIRALVYGRMPQAYLTVLRDLKHNDIRPLIAAMATLSRDVSSDASGPAVDIPRALRESVDRLLAVVAELSASVEVQAGTAAASTKSAAPPTASRKGTYISRHVIPAPAGGWKVVSKSERASACFNTQSEALARAREIVSRLGGGEVVVHNRDGRIRDRKTVGDVKVKS
jgi:DNA-binding transcriptional MerR regulator